MGRIQTLIIGAGVAFLVSGLLNQAEKPGSEMDLDGLLTMGFLVYIWYTLRWATSSKNRPEERDSHPEPEDEDRKPEPDPFAPFGGEERGPETSNLPSETRQPPDPVHPDWPNNETTGPFSAPDQPPIRPASQPVPRLEPGVKSSPTLLNSMRGETVTLLYHKAPWAITERGETVGRFRNTPIPAWIATSDKRHADYNGITDDPVMNGSVCIEVPERSELILPPGLVYRLRS
ncbi:MAG: hypothetical protein HQL67_09845 [Magnetococcales bacterium]|nr:hypothetical protein [Magnetococcales bacterium]